MKVIETRRGMRDRLVVLLPADPAAAGGAADWWFISGDTITARGSGEEWRGYAADRLVLQIGLAPSAALRIDFPDTPAGAAERQRLAIARLAALDRAIADPATLHAVAAALDGEDRALVAVAANDIMLGWLAWAEREGLVLDHIVPAAMVLPLDDEWRRSAVGGDRLLGHLGCVVPDEPGLADALLDGPAEPLDGEALDLAIVRVAHDPRPDLRSGRFVRRRLLIDRARWRTIGLIAASVALVTTLVALVEIVKLERATARLDAETLAIAQSVAGPQVTLTTAEAAVAARGGGGGVSAHFARLLSRLAAERDVSVVNLAATSGTVRTTLASPSPDRASRVLQALQRDGYRVAAVPRQSPDGRALLDLTIGGGA